MPAPDEEETAQQADTDRSLSYQQQPDRRRLRRCSQQQLIHRARRFGLARLPRESRVSCDSAQGIVICPQINTDERKVSFLLAFEIELAGLGPTLLLRNNPQFKANP
jgi:hypothetical protein